MGINLMFRILCKSLLRTIISFFFISFFLLGKPSHLQSVQIFDENAEISLGKKSDEGIIKMYGLYEDKVLQDYVNEIGQKLVDALDEPTFQFYFKVVDSSEINAFALPGGYVYVTHGILATLNSEAELAGILGHEIGHVIAHHGVKQLTKSLGLTLLSLGGAVANPKEGGKWLMVSQSIFNQILLGYGKEAELEADTLGLINAYQAGYDPIQMTKFLRGLKFKEMISGQAYHSFQATHPDTRDRIIRAEDMANSLLRKNKKVELFRENYLSHIAGLKYGGKRNVMDKRLYRKKEFIDLYRVKEGDTFDSIAEQQLGEKKRALDIAILNNHSLKKQLKPGETIKLVRERS
jgi:predicted Zn-dependent protease